MFRKERLGDFAHGRSDFGEVFFGIRHRKPGLGNGILGRLFWNDEHDAKSIVVQPSLQPFLQSIPIALTVTRNWWDNLNWNQPSVSFEISEVAVSCSAFKKARWFRFNQKSFLVDRILIVNYVAVVGKADQMFSTRFLKCGFNWRCLLNICRE